MPRFAPGPVPTLAELRRTSCWLWLDCPACRRRRPVALVPFMIRWGLDASSDLLRKRARCAACGHVGAQTYLPSYGDAVTGFAAFPADLAREDTREDTSVLPGRTIG